MPNNENINDEFVEPIVPFSGLSLGEASLLVKSLLAIFNEDRKEKGLPPLEQADIDQANKIDENIKKYGRRDPKHLSAP